MKKLVLLVGVLSIALLYVLPSAFAQTVTASLSGTVADSTGAVLPGAKVLLTDEATKTSVSATSNGAGYFNFTAVQPGTYDLTVTATGFQKYRETGIVLHQNESRTVATLSMKLGAESQEVTVTAETETVPIDSGASSTTLGQQMVDQIPIQGRDAAELIRLMPGMAINSGLNNTEWNSYTTQINSGPIGSFSASGTQPNGSMQLISNGSVITDAGNQGTQIANINQDMTSEVSIQDSAFDAEYAHGPVTFSALPKRGGSGFHGEGYVDARNGSLNAEDAFQHAKGIQKPVDHYWYEGGNIGGPILPGTRFRDKAHFWVGLEHLAQSPVGALHQYVIPTAAMMAGDYTNGVVTPGVSIAPYASAFHNTGPGNIPCADTAGFWNWSQFCQGAINNGQILLYDQNNAVIPAAAANTAAYSTNCYVPGHGATCVSGARIVDPTLLDPNGQILMKLLAGAPGLTRIDPTTHGGFNAQFLDNPPVNGNELTLNGDVNITSKMKAYATYTRQTESDINNIGLWWWAPDAVPYPSQTPASQLSRAYSFSVTNTLSPSMINEATFGYAYFINPVSLKNPTAANPSTYGYNVTTPYAQPVPQVPDLVSWCCAPGGGGGSPSATPSAGFNASSFGSNPTWYGKFAGKDSYTPDFSDNFTLIKRSHTLKFGFFWAKYANVQTEGACCGGGTVGQWDFDPYAFYSTTNTYADMLLGHAAGFSMASQNFTDNVVYNEYSFFAQDKWQATRRMTLSLGIRFDREGQWFPTNENKGIMVWNPSNTVNPLGSATPNSTGLPGFDWHGQDNSIPVSGWANHSFYADPRVGVSYDLFGNGKTVIRGGFGIYRFNVAYNDVTEASMLDAPLGLKSFGSNCSFSSLAGLGTCGASSAAAISSQTYGGMLPGDNATPYTQNWNVMISQRAPWKSVLEIAYKANRSRDMLLTANGAGGVHINNINYVPVGGFFQPDPAPGADHGVSYYCLGPQTPTCQSSGPPSADVPYYRPLPYKEVDLFRHASYTNYNGMVVQWVKQAGPAIFNLNYTWSHALGIRDGNNDNGQGSGAALDAFNLANNYGTLAFNRFHIFNASYVVDLPSVNTGSAFAKQVFNGWKLSGTTQFQTGPPLQPLTGTGLNANMPLNNQAILGTDGITLQPYLTCDPRKGLTKNQFFNPNCFMAPNVQGKNGPLIWPDIVAPGFFDSDLGMYKDFKVTESQKLEFRFMAFNVLNRANPTFGLGNDVNLSFAAPGGFNTNTSTTGKPAYKVGRRVLELSMKYYF